MAHGSYWTGEEIRTLVGHYPAGGVRICTRLLPGRTKAAIYQAAYELQLKRIGRKPGSGRRPC